MSNEFPGGVWPVMLTPFTKDNQVDYKALGQLVDWYISEGVSGLFAVCQSSEMFFLNAAEKIEIAKYIVERTKNKVPVIASGHTSDELDMQAEEICQMAETGVKAVVLITNRLAKENEDDTVWIKNMQYLLGKIPENIKLGFYECPYPYKRVMSEETVKWCSKQNRFYFLKDTSCDINNIRRKLSLIKDSTFKLYNANTATLLDSLRDGAAGYSGVMANMQAKLYSYLCKNYQNSKAEELSDFLTICALIERQYYPVNAKYFLKKEGLNIETLSRIKSDICFTETFKSETEMLRRLTIKAEKEYIDSINNNA